MSDLLPIARGREKLVAEKERWARERRTFQTRDDAPGGRLPPGQHRARDWPVLDLGTHPNIPAKDWRLSVEGMVDVPTVFTYGELALIPRTERKVDIHCVTSWSRLGDTFAGVSTRDILAEVRPRDEARFVLIKSFDGYTVNLPVDYL